MLFSHRLLQLKFCNGFIFGALVSLIFCFTLFTFLDFHLSVDAWISIFGSFLIAAFSISAALIALRGNRIQIDALRDIEEFRRENALAAAKAILPATLSEICRISQANMKLRFHASDLSINLNVIDSEEIQTNEFELLPENLIFQLKECILHADQISRNHLSEILRNFQVLQARRITGDKYVLEVNDDKLSLDNHSAISEVIGWATVYALTENIFEYARGVADVVPKMDPSRVEKAFLIGGIALENYPLLHNLLTSRIKEGRIENNWKTAA